MPKYIPFTDEQKQRANSVDLVDFLRAQGEEVTRSGNDFRWTRHDSVTIRGNRWFQHSANQGGLVKGFRGWMKHGRMVKPGEKALRIIAPYVKEDERDKEKDDDKMADTFRRINVFDISQTELVEGFQDIAIATAPVQFAAYPFSAETLEGDVEGFNKMLAALRRVSPYPIHIEPITGTKKGYCSYTQRVIGVKKGLSQLHTIKACVHEIAHALLHCGIKGTQQKEIEAESVAFIVCQYFDLDTSDYSFNYIAGYSIGKEKKKLKEFLNTIQKTASFLIDSIEGEIKTREIGYEDVALAVLINKKTIMRMFGQGQTVYLLYPGKGELLVIDKKQLEEYDGPFAVERNVWRQAFYDKNIENANAA